MPVGCAKQLTGINIFSPLFSLHNFYIIVTLLLPFEGENMVYLRYKINKLLGVEYFFRYLVKRLKKIVKKRLF